MRSLQQNHLDKIIRDLHQPVLGICVGMQLLCAHSDENDVDCLNIIPIQVKKFSPSPITAPDGMVALKVPQVGWNTIYDLQSLLFNGIEANSYIYNVHSYYAEDSEFTIAKCFYGIEYAAAVKKDNFYGLQFHTEKSAAVGERIIKNFLEFTWR